jgi:hypothetical protein
MHFPIIVHSPLPRTLCVALAILFVSLATPVSHADITGFGDFSNFTVNVADTGSAPTVSGGTIHLTSGADESRSIFCDTPQSISEFTASFTYQELNGSTNSGPLGACFVVQNSSAGASTVASTYSGGGFQNDGYGDFFGSFNKSAAVSLEGHFGSTTTTFSGTYTNGSGVGNGSTATSPVDFLTGDPINVTLSYNGTTLHETLLDTTTSASYQTSYIINLPSIVGGSTAYVGVTAGNEGAADQYFSNFQMVPEPATFVLLGLGGISLLAYLRHHRCG